MQMGARILVEISHDIANMTGCPIMEGVLAFCESVWLPEWDKEAAARATATSAATCSFKIAYPND
jgi:hypothetical protein